MNPVLLDPLPPLYRLRHHHSPCHQLIKIRLKLVLDWYEGNEDDHFLQVFRLRWSRLISSRNENSEQYGCFYPQANQVPLPLPFANNIIYYWALNSSV